MGYSPLRGVYASATDHLSLFLALSLLWLSVYCPSLNIFPQRHHSPVLRGLAVPCNETNGANWNHLCLAQGSPSLSSQTPSLHQNLVNYTQNKRNSFTPINAEVFSILSCYSETWNLTVTFSGEGLGCNNFLPLQNSAGNFAKLIPQNQKGNRGQGAYVLAKYFTSALL